MPLDLYIDVIIPEIRAHVEKQPEVVGLMANAVKREVLRRWSRGLGAQGRLPVPLDGGRALYRSGTMIDSTRAYPSRRRPDKWVVAPTGKRPDDENVAGKKKRARAKTKRLRERKKRLFMRISGARAAAMGKRELRKALKLGKLRRRTADTNAALAGILSVPPKKGDKRGRNRGVYRLFEPSEHYARAANAAAQEHIRLTLIQIGTRALGSGRRK